MPDKIVLHTPNRGDTGSCNVEAETTTSAAASAGWRDELSPELGEFGLQLTQVVASRLVLLC
jgi:hypothetical protein